jgi:hypothetical protein
MVSEIVRQGRTAWARLKRESRSRGRDQRTWGDWLLVGRALLEGREIAMRQTRPRVEGRVYWPALKRLDHDNRFNCPGRIVRAYSR